MADQNAIGTDLGGKLVEIFHVLRTEEGGKELEKLMGSLEAIKVNDNDTGHDKDYVHVNKTDGGSNASHSPTVCIEAVETWEKQLLSHPKVGFCSTGKGCR